MERDRFRFWVLLIDLVIRLPSSGNPPPSNSSNRDPCFAFRRLGFTMGSCRMRPLAFARGAFLLLGSFSR